VDLNQVALRAGGRGYRPVEASPLTGHHGRGRVVFELPDSIEGFSVVIPGARGLEQRSFDWP